MARWPTARSVVGSFAGWPGGTAFSAAPAGASAAPGAACAVPLDTPPPPPSPPPPPLHEPGPAGAQPDPAITVSSALTDALIKHCADQGLGVYPALAERALAHVLLAGGAVTEASDPDLPGLLISYAKYIWTNREYHVNRAKKAKIGEDRR